MIYESKKIYREFRKYFNLNYNKNRKECQKLWDTANVVFSEKFKYLYLHWRKSFIKL